MINITEKQKNKFWSKVKKTNGCWEFRKSSPTPSSFMKQRVSRFSWMITNGPILNNLFVLHKCDNPHCVRPDHLYLGDANKNMQDIKDRKRQAKNKNFVFNDGEYVTIKEAMKIFIDHGIIRSSVWFRYAAMSNYIKSEKAFNTRVLLKEDVLKAMNKILQKGNLIKKDKRSKK